MRPWLTLTPEIARQTDGVATDTTDPDHETRFLIGAIARFWRLLPPALKTAYHPVRSWRDAPRDRTALDQAAGRGRGGMIVHGYFRSSAAYRLRIALNLKGLSPEFRPVHLRRGDQKREAYRALNPQGLVPALETGDGTVLTQSLAISSGWTRLARAAAAAGRPEHQETGAAFALAIACDIHRCKIFGCSIPESAYGRSRMALNAWCRHSVGQGLAACEALLEREPQGPSPSAGRPGSRRST